MTQGCVDEENGLQPSEPEMKLALIKASNKEINQAGRYLASFRHNEEISDEDKGIRSFLLLADWRASHAYALRIVQTILRQNARRFDTGASVSGRLKRRLSIIAKLRRQSTMQLTTMGDIGGCRAVLEDIRQVRALADFFRMEVTPKLNESPKEKDYIAEPKPDGYRSIHWTVRFSRPVQSPHTWRIEIQIRTQLQHEWATALETVDLFTGQTLKTGGGNPKWKRFFVLASSLFAMREECPIVPNTPKERQAIIQETAQLWSELHVKDKLFHWSSIMHSTIPTGPPPLGPNSMYLVELDHVKGATTVTVWSSSDIEKAHLAYAEAERKNADNSNWSGVLVAAESIEEMRKMFPSYYGDTRSFLLAVLEEIQQS